MTNLVGCAVGVSAWKLATAHGAPCAPLQTQSVHAILTAAGTNCKYLPEIATSASGLLAMTNLGGHCLFNIGPHFPPVRWREGHAPPLQRMTGGLVKFSTFQVHFPRAAPLHMCYPILQKGLLRGSCSRPFAPREGNRRYQRWTTVPASPRTAAPACASEAIMACPPVLANETAALTFGSMEPGAKWPSSQ